VNELNSVSYDLIWTLPNLGSGLMAVGIFGVLLWVAYIAGEVRKARNGRSQ
jgi:hypothetical protein